MVVRLSPTFLDLWNKSKDMYEDFALWHRIRAVVISGVPFLDERVRLPHVHARGTSGGAPLQVGELLDRVLRRHLDPEGSERITPQDLLALPALCRGSLEQAALDGRELLQFDGDEEGSLPWCISILCQCYAPDDLQQDRDKGLSELKYLLRPMAAFLRDVYSLRAPFAPSTKGWFFAAFDEWFAAGPENRCMLCTGPVGSGMTVASAELVIRRRQRIQAFLFCRRTQSERQNPASVIRSLAMQLALSVPGLWPHMLKGARTLAVDADDTTLFTRLLEEPLGRLRPDAEGMDPRGLILLLDGLDEASAPPTANPIVLLLTKLLYRLPPWVRFVLCASSRVEEAGLEAVVSVLKPGTLVEVDVTQPAYKEDLRLVVEQHLQSQLEDRDAAEMALAVNKVAEASRGSFAFVDTFVSGQLVPLTSPTSRFIVNRIRPQRCVELCAASSHLDPLLRGMLQGALARGGLLGRRMLQILLVAREDVLVGDLAKLLDDDDAESEAFVRALDAFGPLIDIQGPLWAEKRVRLAHRTIADLIRSAANLEGPDLSRLASEAAATVSEMAPRIVRSGLFGAALASSMASKLPGYVIRHAVAHAIAAEDIPAVEGLLLDVRFLKAIAEERMLDGLVKEIAQAALKLRPAPGLSVAISEKRRQTAVAEFAQWLPFANLTQLHASPNAIYQAVLLAPSSWIRRSSLPLLLPHLCSGLPSPETDEATANGEEGEGAGAGAGARTGSGSAKKTLFAVPSYVPRRLPEGPKVGSLAPAGSRNVIEIFRTTSRISEPSRSDSKAPPLYGHSENIQTASFSPDGRYCLTTSTDCTAILWGLDLGPDATPIHTLRGHNKGVVSGGWSPEGAHVVTGSIDGSVFVWNVQTGETAATLPAAHNDMVISCSFCPSDGALFFSATLRSISTWNLTALTASSGPTREPALALVPFKDDTAQIVSARWAPVGMALLVASSEGIGIWDGRSGAKLHSLNVSETDGAIQTVAWSPDGARVLAGTSTGRLLVFNAFDSHSRSFSAMTYLGGHSAGIRCVAWSADGARALSGAFNSTLSLWDMRQPSACPLLQEMQCPGSRLECFFSSTTERLVSYGNEPFLLIHDQDVGASTSTSAAYVSAVAVAGGVLEPHVLADFSGFLNGTFSTGSSVYAVVSYDLGRLGESHVVSKLQFLGI